MRFQSDLIYCKVGNFIEMYVFGSSEYLKSLFGFLIFSCFVVVVVLIHADTDNFMQKPSAV